MRSRSLALALAICVATLQAEDKVENPFRTAKVGDFVVYKMTQKGLPKPTTMRQTVTAVTPKEVTIEIRTTFDGKDLPPTETKFDLTKSLDPATLSEGKAAVTNLGTGKEKMTVNGKEYDCTWTRTKVVTKVLDKDFTSESKTWTSKEVPLNGVVKVETTNDISTVTMELVEFGSKK